MFDEDTDLIGGSTDILPDHYKSYVQFLLRVPALTAAEQVSLQQLPPVRGRLWLDALRLVLYVLHKMRRLGQLPAVRLNDMDAIQAANLAVGEALPYWNPAAGTLSTYLVPRIRGALLDYQAREIRAGRFVSIDDEDVSSDDIADSDVPAELSQSMPVSETVEQTTFPNPEIAAYHVQISDRVQRMPTHARDLLESYFYRDEPIISIAERYQTTAATIYNRLAWALSRNFWKNF